MAVFSLKVQNDVLDLSQIFDIIYKLQESFGNVKLFHRLFQYL
ncbi:hypothetical protein RV03_GL001213 [Enterococcus gallinarum]|nr:hypothetical protein RV03_GL001213 [Enterococcus gallinarum]